MWLWVKLEQQLKKQIRIILMFSVELYFRVSVFKLWGCNIIEFIVKRSQMLSNPQDISCMSVDVQACKKFQTKSSSEVLKSWPLLYPVCSASAACFIPLESFHKHSLLLCYSQKTLYKISHSSLQEVKHIGSTHNRSALPFTGFGSKVVTNQYNNPSGLYSSENIKDFNSAVDEVKTMTTSNEPDSK